MMINEFVSFNEYLGLSILLKYYLWFKDKSPKIIWTLLLYIKLMYNLHKCICLGQAILAIKYLQEINLLSEYRVGGS